MLNIIILGPQGSGKGTQAKLLAEKFNLEHFDTGRALRQIARKNTPLGRKVANKINRGFIVSTNLLADVLKEKIKNIPCKKGIVFDGVPRNMPQVKVFEKVLGRQKRKITNVFLIWISRKESLKRLEKRRVCKKCGSIFISERSEQVLILGKNLSQKTRKCPKCGGEIYQREDDQPETIKKRLTIYYQRTLPVIRYYYLRGKMTEINGEQSIKKVFEDILDNLTTNN